LNQWSTRAISMYGQRRRAVLAIVDSSLELAPRIEDTFQLRQIANADHVWI
jgi:hypothetical protein